MAATTASDALNRAIAFFKALAIVALCFLVPHVCWEIAQTIAEIVTRYTPLSVSVASSTYEPTILLAVGAWAAVQSISRAAGALF